MIRIHKITTQKEVELTKWFYSIFRDRIAKPVLCRERKDGLVELVSEHAEGIAPLEKIHSGQYFYDDLLRAVRFLAEMHAKGLESPYLEDILSSEPECFINRIKNIFFSNVEKYNSTPIADEIKQVLTDNWQVVEKRLRNAYLSAYNDFNLRNLFFAATFPVRFDIEYLRLFPAQTDLINLLEFECEYLNSRQRKALILEYIHTAEKITRKRIDKKEFFQDYKFAALQRHLELIGYRARDAEGKDVLQFRAQLYHLRKAQEHLDDLLLSKEIRDEEKSALKNIQSGLSGINILPEEFSYLKTEQPAAYIVDPFLRKNSAKIAIASLLVALAMPLSIGYAELSSRNIPSFNRHLFAGAKMAVIRSEEEQIEPNANSTLYIVTGANKLELLMDGVSEPISWSDDKSKILFIHGSVGLPQLIVFDFATGKKSKYSYDQVISGDLLLVYVIREYFMHAPEIPSAELIKKDTILEHNGLKLYFSEGVLSYNYNGKSGKYPELAELDWLKCTIQNNDIYYISEKGDIQEVYMSKTDGSGFKKIMRMENKDFFLYFR